MQSLEIDGLKEVIQTLETTPEVIRQARAEFFDETGEVLLEAVQRHIGGSSRVAGVQESHVGSGKAMWPSGLWQRLIWMATQRVILPMRWKTAML